MKSTNKIMQTIYNYSSEQHLGLYWSHSKNINQMVLKQVFDSLNARMKISIFAPLGTGECPQSASEVYLFDFLLFCQTHMPISPSISCPSKYFDSCFLSDASSSNSNLRSFCGPQNPVSLINVPKWNGHSSNFFDFQHIGKNAPRVRKSRCN